MHCAGYVVTFQYVHMLRTVVHYIGLSTTISGKSDMILWIKRFDGKCSSPARSRTVKEKHWWLVCVSGVTCLPLSARLAIHPKSRAFNNLQDDDTLLQNADILLQEELLQLQCSIFSRNRPDPLKRPHPQNQPKFWLFVIKILEFYWTIG